MEMTDTKSKPRPNRNPSGPVVVKTAPSSENLDKVREILFGEQIRERDHRLAELESRLTVGIAKLREETQRSVESLRSNLNRETQSLMSRLGTETSEREASDKQIMSLLKEAQKTLEDRVNQVDQRAIKAEGEIRQSMTDQLKLLRQEFDQKQVTLNQALNQSTTEIRDRMVDRSNLAALLNDLANTLGGENGRATRSK